MKSIIYTVDVEGHDGNDPVNNLIYGNLPDGSKIGIDLLMDCFDKYNIKGVFFVDIAEAWDYGEEKIASVLRHIKNRNHDVGVHIHPDHMSDRGRLFLYEYSYSEQYDIISKCTEFYTATLGERPIAFRAGKYGANRETLEILYNLGYKVDFSEFCGQKWCGLNPPITGSQTVELDNGLIEIPVTVYESMHTPVYKRNDKLDDSMRLDEFKIVLKKLAKSSYTQNIVLFSHSFSLMNWRTNPSNPTLNTKALRKLEMMLDYAQKIEDIEFSSLNEIIKRTYPNSCGDAKVESLLSGFEAIYYFVLRAIRVIKTRIENRKGNLTR